MPNFYVLWVLDNNEQISKIGLKNINQSFSFSQRLESINDYLCWFLSFSFFDYLSCFCLLY